MNGLIKLWFRKDGKAHANKRYNKYDLSGNFGIGYTLKGEEFYFDLEDFEKIQPHCWRVGGGGRLVARNSAGGTEIKFHRLIMGFPNLKFEIDHIDRNQLNNRKENLRICFHKENIRNRNPSKNNTSGITGVFKREYGAWGSFLERDGRIFRETHASFEEAVKARLLAEKEYFGEFAPQKHLFKQYNIV